MKVAPLLLRLLLLVTPQLVHDPVVRADGPQTGTIDELRVGNIVARNLKVVSAPGLDLDVIGMNFLSQLESWRVEGRTLILVPHHPQRTSRG